MDIERLRNLTLPPVERVYEARDAILYALGLGYGSDPLDESELPFVYEEHLKVVPSICSVMSQPGFWIQDPIYKVDWIKILHAEQNCEIHRPLPSSGLVRGECRILGIDDRGPHKGAMLHVEKTLFGGVSSDKLATVRSTALLRGDGGQGGFGEPVEAAESIPARTPDKAVEIPTLPSAALIYRLSGDLNPLHADPASARKAGFERPILHGLCTYGIACRAILRTYCGNDTARLKSLFARFSAPVYPGETIRLEFYEDGAQLRFKARAKERNIVVLDRCSATIGR